MSVFQEKKKLQELGINEKVKVKVHYFRDDDNYDNWNVWMWKNDESGQQVDFFEDTEDNLCGKVAIFNVETPEELDKIGFIIRKSVPGNEWLERESEEDKFVLMKNIDDDGNINVFVKQDDPRIRFKKAKVEKEKDLKVRIHYSRLHNDYDNWNLWVWENDEKGQRIEFTGEDSYGRVAEFNVSKATFTDELGFIVRKSYANNEWSEKDGLEDRVLLLREHEKNGVVNIYLRQNEPKMFFRKPVMVNFHYKRYDNNYYLWDVWAWKKYTDEVDEPGQGVKFLKDDYSYGRNSESDVSGKIATFMLGNTEGVEKLGFLVRKSNKYDNREEWLDWDIDLDRYVDIEKISEIAKDGKVDIYLAQGDINIGFSETDIDLSPRIVDVTIPKVKDNYSEDNFHTIDVELNTKFDLNNDTKMDFELRCGDTIIPINNVQYSGEKREDKGRFFKVEVKDNHKLEPFDKRYTLSLKGFKSLPVSIRKLYDHEGFIKKLTYDGDDLGVTYSKDNSKFRVWAPTADYIDLLLYDKGTKSEIVRSIPLNKSEKGTWFLKVDEDLKGKFYKYRACVEGKVYEVVDPYAKAAGVNGERGAIIDFEETNPEGWHETTKPKFDNFTDAVICELHIRDYTIDKNSGVSEKNRGKYLGLTEIGTKTPGKDGVTTGLSHLVEQGYTHVQEMPIMDFDGVDETLDNPKGYNWGYNPVHWNVLEGSYATDAFDPTVRIKEFKKKVQAYSRNGIRLVIDAVYNHTFKTQYSNLNILVPKYYHRVWEHTGDFSNATECSNEIASERKMARKLIVDSIKNWAKEYKVSGFRFDVMYLLDIDTMNEIKKAVYEIDPYMLLYGEGWLPKIGTPISQEKLATKNNATDLRGIGFFNNEGADAIKGSFDDSSTGFATMALHMDREARLKRAIVADVQHPDVHRDRGDQVEPSQTVNYVGAHDNLTWWDKICKSVKDKTEEVKIKMYKLGYSILFTMQGMIMIPEGDEFMRTKSGHYNSYNSGDSVNKIDWERKKKFRHVADYIKGLGKLRASHPAFRMSSSREIREKLRFFNLPEPNMIGFTIKDHANGDISDTLVVIHNGYWKQTEVELPGKGWSVLVDDKKAGDTVLSEIDGNKVSVPAHSTMVLSDTKSIKTIGSTREELGCARRWGSINI